jgi:hypothetical protein
VPRLNTIFPLDFPQLSSVVLTVEDFVHKAKFLRGSLTAFDVKPLNAKMHVVPVRFERRDVRTNIGLGLPTLPVAPAGQRLSTNMRKANVLFLDWPPTLDDSDDLRVRQISCLLIRGRWVNLKCVHGCAGSPLTKTDCHVQVSGLNHKSRSCGSGFGAGMRSRTNAASCRRWIRPETVRRKPSHHQLICTQTSNNPTRVIH